MLRNYSAGKAAKGLLVCAALLTALLCGCGGESPQPPATTAPLPTETTAPEPVPTIPPDGKAGTIHYKGTYTHAGALAASRTVVATVGEAQLPNSLLQVFYRMEVAAWQQGGHAESPDFSKPLDTQRCEADETVVTWQQFFLKRALNTWHSVQALEFLSHAQGLPLEEAYQPKAEDHERYMTGMPALVDLYGYDEGFEPNELHQAYLDGIPTMLDALAVEEGFSGTAAMVQDFTGPSAGVADLQEYTRLYNWGYMYFTNLSYYLEQSEEDITACFEENKDAFSQDGITADSGRLADIRQILIVPEGSVADDGTVTATEEAWETALKTAQNVRNTYDSNLRKSKRRAQKTTADAVFAALANKESRDAGTALDGGLYQNLRSGQLPAELDQWVFDEARQPEDVEILRTAYGYHIVFLKSTEDIWHAAARTLLNEQQLEALIADAREKYPMSVDYSSIRLDTPSGSAALSPDALLYADIAHERFPSVPLYLQQDYPDTMYGNYKITSHGCGITTMAMLASYMADDELTPPEMCARYGDYCYSNGTDGILFVNAPPELGFYLKERTYKPQLAKAAMEKGYVVVCVQQKGYWTRGGHYLVLEEIFEDDMIRVRDSNIFNYERLERHKDDLFPWNTIPPSGTGYWIYEYKITSIPACTRCGDPQGVSASMVSGGYLCEKCIPALLRRTSYLTLCGDAT